MNDWDDYFNYPNYPRSAPRETEGGIKARSKRGAFGQSLWGKKWVAMLEVSATSGRLSRGKSYARSGQVQNITVSKGKVTAQIQGSRLRPYKVSIRLELFLKRQWAVFARELATQPLLAAKLFAGEMPEEVAEVVARAGLSLLPESFWDLRTKCSCPDYSEPCKHSAAVYYLMAEEIDRDPFILFRLRGLEREELLAQLGKAAGVKRKKALTKADNGADVATEATVEPLAPDPDIFWQGGDLPGSLAGDIAIPTTAAAWPKQLGNFPFWRGKRDLLEALEEIYAKAAQQGLSILSGEMATGGLATRLRADDPRPTLEIKDVFLEVSDYYERQIDWEPAVRRDWVEHFLQSLAFQSGGDGAALNEVWQDVYAFAQYADRLDYATLGKLPWWEFSLSYEWVASHIFSAEERFALRLKQARRYMHNILALYQYLYEGGVVNDIGEVQQAYEYMCGGRKLNLVKHIPMPQ